MVLSAKSLSTLFFIVTWQLNIKLVLLFHQSQQVALEKALQKLQREDPSLSVSFNEETSQVILGGIIKFYILYSIYFLSWQISVEILTCPFTGMGELHLDIIKERLLTEYKLDIMLGPIQIAYREALNSPVEERKRIQETIGMFVLHFS